MSARITSLLVLLGSVTFSSLQAGNELLFDDFSGASLDLGKWQTILPGGSSSITQSGGYLTTNGRGILATAAPFSGPLVVSGSFIMLDHFEHFKIALRTNLSLTGGFNEVTGLIVAFSNDGNDISIQELTNPIGNWRLIASMGGGGYVLESGQTYNFSITDSGNAISVSLNGSHVLSANTTFSTGENIAFYSREFPNTGTKIDSVKIEGVPDGVPTIWLAAIAGLGVLLMRRPSLRRK